MSRRLLRRPPPAAPPAAGLANQQIALWKSAIDKEGLKLGVN